MNQARTIVLATIVVGAAGLSLAIASQTAAASTFVAEFPADAHSIAGRYQYWIDGPSEWLNNGPRLIRRRLRSQRATLIKRFNARSKLPGHLVVRGQHAVIWNESWSKTVTSLGWSTQAVILNLSNGTTVDVGDLLFPGDREGQCGRDFRLLGVADDGEVIVRTVRPTTDGADPCSATSYLISVVGINPDGAIRQVGSVTFARHVDDKWLADFLTFDDLPFAVEGQYSMSPNGTADDEDHVTVSRAGDGLATVVFGAYTVMESASLSANGAALFGYGDYPLRDRFYPDASNSEKFVLLKRRRGETFRICGDTVIGFSNRRFRRTGKRIYRVRRLTANGLTDADWTGTVAWPVEIADCNGDMVALSTREPIETRFGDYRFRRYLVPMR